MMAAKFDFYGEIVPDGYADVIAATLDNEQLVDDIDGELNVDRDRRHTARLRALVLALTPTVIDLVEAATAHADMPLIDGKDDRISATGLAHILDQVERMPNEFDVSSMNASPNSVTVTFKFPVAGPTAQLETAELLIQAALCTGTLARNLHHERSTATVESDNPNQRLANQPEAPQ